MITTILLGFGWVLAGVFFGLWHGTVKTHKVIYNMREFGAPNPLQKAVISADPQPEDRLDTIFPKRENRDGKFQQETIDTGVKEMLELAAVQGQALTPEQAREEVMEMLNSDDGMI